MAAPAKKRRARRDGPGHQASAPASIRHSEVGSGSVAERGLAEGMQLAGEPALSLAARLRVLGLNVDQTSVPEKEKVSITLDKALVEEIRDRFGGRALSASINELLHAALVQQRLGQLVEEMEQESGPESAEAYERVLAQWFAEG